MHQLLVIACGVRGDSPLLILLHQVGVWLGEVCLLYPVDHCAFSHQPFILSASCWFLDPVPTYIVFCKTENVNIVLLCELPEYHEFEIPIGLWDDASYILETIQIMLLFFPSSWPHNSQWPGIVASSKVGAGSITVGGFCCGCAACRLVGLTSFCTGHWPHDAWPDLCVWPLAGCWLDEELVLEANNAAICSASWLKWVRNILFICLISLTCLVSWDMEVACEAILGESLLFFPLVLPLWV